MNKQQLDPVRNQKPEQDGKKSEQAVGRWHTLMKLKKKEKTLKRTQTYESCISSCMITKIDLILTSFHKKGENTAQKQILISAGD